MTLEVAGQTLEVAGQLLENEAGKQIIFSPAFPVQGLDCLLTASSALVRRSEDRRSSAWLSRVDRTARRACWSAPSGTAAGTAAEDSSAEYPGRWPCWSLRRPWPRSFSCNYRRSH